MHLGQLESSASSAECGALELQSNYCYIQTEIYEPKSIEIKIVSSRQRSQLIGHTIFFASERRDETNGRIDSSRAEQVSERVPFNGSQKRRQRGLRA